MGLPAEPLSGRRPLELSSEWTIPEQQVEAQDLRRLSFDKLMSRISSWGRLLVYFRNKPTAVMVSREEWDRLVERVTFLDEQVESRLLGEQLAERAQAAADPSRKRSEADFWAAYERTFQ